MIIRAKIKEQPKIQNKRVRSRSITRERFPKMLEQNSKTQLVTVGIDLILRGN